MIRKAISILIAGAVMGLIFSVGITEAIAQRATGYVRIVERNLPNAEITVTGIGYSPKRSVSPAQKRLLAQRAATVDAYRVLVSTLNGISGYVAKGSGYVEVSGYVKGASISQVREFADGKVEVDLRLPVSLLERRIGGKVTWDKIVTDISKKGYPAYYVRQPVEQISEEEWLNLIEKKEGL